MIRLKMHAMYDHFPELNPKDGEPFIDCFADSHVFECNGPGKNIALLLEPRSMLRDADRYVDEHPEYFRYIFTHDTKILQYPNARELNWADVWLTTDSPKTKGISLMTSFKNWCPLHKARLELAEYFRADDKVDVFFGDWNNPNIPTIEARDYLEEYKFSIIIENDIDEYWYTEKILNCFSTKTVPIYVGASKIGERFNPLGICQIEDWKDIPAFVENLYKIGLDAIYHNAVMQEAIEDNFKRVEPYNVKWKERFFRDYGDLLEGLMYE